MPTIPYDTWYAKKPSTKTARTSWSQYSWDPDTWYSNGTYQSDSFSGVMKNGPKLSSRRVNGIRNATSYSTASSTVSYMDGEVIYDRGYMISRYQGSTPFSDAFGPGWDSIACHSGTANVEWSYNMANRVRTECALKLKGQKVNLGIALAESRATVSHLSRTISDLLRVALAARRGRWSEVSRILKLGPNHIYTGRSFSERWLEVQYGWKPLISDIAGSYDVLVKGMETRPQYFGVSRNIKVDVPLPYPSKWGVTNIICSGKRSQHWHAKIYATVDDFTAITTSALGLQFTPSNMLFLGWNLIPYSFVVDWILPIGDWLDALDAFQGYRFLAGYTSVYAKEDLTFETRPDKVGCVGSIPYSWKATGYVREPMSGFPLPLPYVKNPLSSSHVTSALALFNQMRR